MVMRRVGSELKLTTLAFIRAPLGTEIRLLSTVIKTVQNSVISEGGNIAGTVDFAVIFPGVTIEEGAEVRDSIIMPGVTIGKGAVVQYAIVAEGAKIGEGAVVGGRPEDTPTDEWGVAVVASGRKIGKGRVVAPRAMIEEDIREEEN